MAIATEDVLSGSAATARIARGHLIAFVLMLAFFALGPTLIYPVFLMKVMCFGLYACAFNLLLGFAGLLSFGHAMFLGMAGYISAHTAKHGLVIESIRAFGMAIPLHINLPPFNPEFAILTGGMTSLSLGVIT